MKSALKHHRDYPRQERGRYSRLFTEAFWIFRPMQELGEAWDVPPDKVERHSKVLRARRYRRGRPFPRRVSRSLVLEVTGEDRGDEPYSSSC